MNTNNFIIPFVIDPDKIAVTDITIDGNTVIREGINAKCAKCGWKLKEPIGSFGEELRFMFYPKIEGVKQSESWEDFCKRTTEEGLINLSTHQFPKKYKHYRTNTYYRECKLCGLYEVIHKEGNHGVNPPKDVIEYYSAENVHLGNDCPTCPPCKK